MERVRTFGGRKFLRDNLLLFKGREVPGAELIKVNMS